jgi:hypothetical protein
MIPVAFSDRLAFARRDSGTVGKTRPSSNREAGKIQQALETKTHPDDESWFQPSFFEWQTFAFHVKLT